MLSSQILIPSKPFFSSSLNPHSKPLLKLPLRFTILRPLASKKGKDSVHENPKRGTENGGGILRNEDASVPNSEQHEQRSKHKSEDPIPFMKPRRKKNRGRPSESQYVEDYVRKQLEQTFSSIRDENPELFEDKVRMFEDHLKNSNSDEESESDSCEKEEEEEEEEEKEEEVEDKDEDEDWPLDADVGWGIRASEYFEKHPIKNVVDENGVEIDWERELDNGWVQEINCLEWESFAFHPSPLVVLIFERYKRPADNWRFLNELEKAAKVYWSSKDHLPPRTVKIDVNIEEDLASALKVKETDCPQLLFLRGNYILYREKEIRSSDEIVKMIAHFYYNARKPDFIDSGNVTSFKK